MATDDQPIHAVLIETAAEDVSALDELMGTLDLPPQAVSSYEDLESATGKTFILCDTPEVVVMQYSDVGLTDVRVIVATGRSCQYRTAVRPVLDPTLVYEHKGRRKKGAFWMEHGIPVGTSILDADELRFTAVK